MMLVRLRRAARRFHPQHCLLVIMLGSLLIAGIIWVVRRKKRQATGDAQA